MLIQEPKLQQMHPFECTQKVAHWYSGLDELCAFFSDFLDPNHCHKLGHSVKTYQFLRRFYVGIQSNLTNLRVQKLVLLCLGYPNDLAHLYIFIFAIVKRSRDGIVRGDNAQLEDDRQFRRASGGYWAADSMVGSVFKLIWRVICRSCATRERIASELNWTLRVF